MGTTTFHRKNLDTLVFETAGQVEWFSSFNATVLFGVDEVNHLLHRVCPPCLFLLLDPCERLAQNKARRPVSYRYLQ